MVLPARAGMSPVLEAAAAYWCSAPRASGDEPSGGKMLVVLSECSPRERG